MNLYLLTQEEVGGYDSYDSCVVAAETVDEARMIRPDTRPWGADRFATWATLPENVTVKLIGYAAPGIATGVILASFNAG